MDMDRQQAYAEFVGHAHLYYQQYQIDEFPIDAQEFQRRLAAVNFVANVTEFQPELSNDAYGNEMVQRTLQLLLSLPTT